MRAAGLPTDVDVIITEIGGTVGDIESLPFLEAARQVRHDLGRDNVFFLHVSLVPYIGPSGELKTKPTQHSVAALRTHRHPAGRHRAALRPGGAREHQAQDRADVRRRRRGSDQLRRTRRGSTTSRACCTPRAWTPTSCAASACRSATSTGTAGADLLERVHEPEHSVEVALVGKYIDLPDAYLSVTEALRAGGFDNDAKVVIRWVASDDCQTPEGAQARARGRRRGAGARAGSASVASRASSARCAGPARTSCRRSASAWACSAWSSSTRATCSGWADASSTEFDPDPQHPVDRDDGRAAGDRRRARATWAAPCGWAPTRRCSRPAPWSRRRTAASGSPSGTGTATR